MKYLKVFVAAICVFLFDACSAFAVMTTFTVTKASYVNLGAGPMIVFFKPNQVFLVYHGSAPPALDSDAVELAQFTFTASYEYRGTENVYMKYTQNLAGNSQTTQQVNVSK
jgi:hypothetical protein